MVFLLDLMAVAPNPRWFTLALAFINAYDNAPVIAALKKTLGDADGHGMDLMGRSDKFRKSRQGKTASPKDRRRGR